MKNLSGLGLAIVGSVALIWALSASTWGNMSSSSGGYTQPVYLMPCSVPANTGHVLFENASTATVTIVYRVVADDSNTAYMSIRSGGNTPFGVCQAGRSAAGIVDLPPGDSLQVISTALANFDWNFELR